MSVQTKQVHRNLRAAMQIHEHLSGSGRCAPLPILYDHEWEELTSSIRRYELVRDKGWQTAADSLLSGLNMSAVSLGRRLDRFRLDLPSIPAAMQVSGPRDIAADLAALAEEFEEVELDLQKKRLSVLTSSIELQDVNLGPFRVLLHWQQIGQGACYEVIATDPHPAEGHDETTHPHVSSQQLCEGEGSTAIRKALAQGRLLDFFTLVKQILETYNPDSAYVSLSRWNGGSDCYDCGSSVADEDSWSCTQCEQTICDCCRHTCNSCGDSLCSACYLPCAGCHEIFCRSCLEFRPGTRVLICNTCLEEGENLDDEKSPPSPETEQPGPGCPCGAPPPADPVCLEEALVPA